MGLYKDCTTSRGLNYHYYFHPATRESKITLLLLHGFPSTSYDWRHQTTFFEGLGFGLIVPDQLGYGGTSKPTDPAEYTLSLIAKDLIDLLDVELEKEDRIVVIGHDWGSKVTSRLANFFPERFAAFAFLAVPYVPPSPDFDLEKALAQSREKYGYETVGYWKFFAEDGAVELIEKHWDSFVSIIFPHDPAMWKSDLCNTGALKAWLEADKQLEPVSYITEEEQAHQKDLLLKDGMSAPLNWYKVLASGIAHLDDKSVPKENYRISKPAFLGAAKQDYIAVSSQAIAVFNHFCDNPTIREFDAGHWLLLSHADEVNAELKQWIEGVEGKL